MPFVFLWNSPSFSSYAEFSLPLLFGVQDMKSAVITPCGHFFHASCLKKWLYVQESCPLCHGPLKSQSAPTSAPVTAPPDAAPASPNAERQDLVAVEEDTQAGEASPNVTTQSSLQNSAEPELKSDKVQEEPCECDLKSG